MSANSLAADENPKAGEEWGMWLVGNVGKNPWPDLLGTGGGGEKRKHSRQREQQGQSLGDRK